ncbi:IS256 family transposase [bacterium]|nr:IS256 family transposase [bacterium]
MARVPHIVHKRKKSKTLGFVEVVNLEDLAALELDSRLELIRSLIPLGLAHVMEELDREVVSLAGPRYRRKSGPEAPSRHGTNPGSVKLAGQTIPLRVPRLRHNDTEVQLASYADLHRGGDLDEAVFRRVLYGISCRNYEQAAECIPGAIGLSKTTVSNRFTKASAKILREFQERDLADLDLVAVFLDGKSFAADQMVIAVGVDLDGYKHILGFVQTETENERAITQFLKSLLARGLDASAGLIGVIDGAKGLRAALLKTFAKRIVIQRCQWHKRENVVSYLAKSEQKYWRGRLQRAYQRPTYAEAKRELLKIRRELSEINESAVASLDEGFEETLTLHRLGLFGVLGKSLKTTNIIESINAQAEERCARVDYWKNSNQKQRWLAAALTDIEPRLRRLCGYRHLPKLRQAILVGLEIRVTDKGGKLAA